MTKYVSFGSVHWVPLPVVPTPAELVRRSFLENRDRILAMIPKIPPLEDESPCSPEELEEIMGLLVEGAKRTAGDALLSVILYGSYARGNYDAESDINVAFICAKDDATELDDLSSIMIGEISEIMMDHLTFISSTWIGAQDFAARKGWLPRYVDIATEGIVYYTSNRQPAIL